VPGLIQRQLRVQGQDTRGATDGIGSLLNEVGSLREKEKMPRPSIRYTRKENRIRGARDASGRCDIVQGMSFVIVTYNSMETIAKCITSVLAQEIKPLEVFVVDNASVDGTPDFIESEFPEAMLICNENNLGYGAANNIAALAAHGEFVAIVNPDVELDPKWSTEITSVIQHDGRCCAAEGKLLMADKPGVINCAGSSITLLAFGCMTHYGESAAAAAEGRLVGYASGAAFAISRDLFLKVGGFDESYFLYHEDVDLGLRMYESGWQIRYAPRAIAYHHYKSTLSPGKVRCLERNRWKTLVKHMPMRYFLVCAPLIAVSEVGLTAKLLRMGLVSSKARAALDFCRDLPQTLRARRAIRDTALVPNAALQLLTDDFPGIIPRTRTATVFAERLFRMYYYAFLRSEPVLLMEGRNLRET